MAQSAMLKLLGNRTDTVINLLQIATQNDRLGVLRSDLYHNPTLNFSDTVT